MSLPSERVFVFHFPPVPHVYSVCPFAIKLESFLRINGIPYEPVYTTGQMSKKGMMPYIRFGDPEHGDELPDSNVIIARFQKEYPQVTDNNLTPMDRAVTHTITRMLEEHTAQIGFYYRYGLKMPEFYESLDIADRFGNPKGTDMWLKFQPDATKDKTKKRGLSRHSDEEIWAFSNDDIQALSDILGDKKYFFGDVPTLADCAVFGHLSQFLFIPIDFPQRAYMKEQCPNLVQFVDNFQREHWPDWEECCQKKPNARFAKKAVAANDAAEEKKE
ncbi:Failed axon connections homolog [Seminavis robusta]|uniref:Failed axon connections homolog n=1 Tax=Seminavis robusta TaxID=568900 RepID=A0A9N8EXS8_9STRA|nr:Failed axon connections homolog [Seminavis robusta]|eukprot:Sro2426_g327330.1 Failed axon connections homolog (274) ;mRNA; r:13474-14295